MQSRLVVSQLIKNEQWDDFKALFPSLTKLSGYTTRNGESILHLVARFASLSFAQKIIRFYHLDNEESLTIKELWSRRDQNGELCVNFERFKQYFNQPFLDKVEAVYSGRYFEHPDEQWPDKKQTHPRVYVYKLMRRYALRAAFDNEEVNNQKKRRAHELPVLLYMPSAGNRQRVLSLSINLSSRKPFLRQLYEQLDCPEDAMSPMLANIYLCEQSLKNEIPKQPNMQTAFQFFQETEGSLKFRNAKLSEVSYAQMYADTGGSCPPCITICCPSLQVLPASFNEAIQLDPQGHWLYDSFVRNRPRNQETTENLFHELLHVVDLQQNKPLTSSKIFAYAVLCLFSRLQPKDKNVINTIKDVLSYYSASQAFREFAPFLVANTKPSSNLWWREIRKLVDLQVMGVHAPAVVNRINMALQTWSKADIQRMDSFVADFYKLYKKRRPKITKKTKYKTFVKRMDHFVRVVNAQAVDFFKANPDLIVQTYRTLRSLSKDLTELMKDPNILGQIVLSEGWLRLLSEFSTGVLPEKMVLMRILYAELCPEELVLTRFYRLLDTCPKKMKSSQDVDTLLASIVYAQKISTTRNDSFLDDSMLLNGASYTHLTNGTLLNSLRRYAHFLIRHQAQQVAPRIIRTRKKVSSQEFSKEKED